MVAHTRAPLRADRLRALNVPTSVEVVTNDAGVPVELVEGEDTRTIVEVLEQWRVDDEWWRRPLARRYFDLALEGGGHVIVFEDLITERWFVQMP